MSGGSAKASDGAPPAGDDPPRPPLHGMGRALPKPNGTGWHRLLGSSSLVSTKVGPRGSQKSLYTGLVGDGPYLRLRAVPVGGRVVKVWAMTMDLDEYHTRVPVPHPKPLQKYNVASDGTRALTQSSPARGRFVLVFARMGTDQYAPVGLDPACIVMQAYGELVALAGIGESQISTTSIHGLRPTPPPPPQPHPRRLRWRTIDVHQARSSLTTRDTGL